MAKQNILKDAKNGTRIYNSDHDIFYIKTEKGWQKDDEFTSIYRRQNKQTEGTLNFGLRNEKEPAPTIGSDGSYSITEKGFVITDKSNPKIADTLRKSEQARVNVRDKLAIKRKEELELDEYNKLKKSIDQQIKFYQGQKAYKNLNMAEVFKKAYKSGDPAKYLLNNHNIRIGRTKFDDAFTTQSGIEDVTINKWFPGLKGGPTGMVGENFFNSYGKLRDLEKKFNINQPKKVSDDSTVKQGSIFDVSQNNQNDKNNQTSSILNRGTLIAGELKPGMLPSNNNTTKSNNNNNSNEIKPNDKVQQHRFSWEKDLNPKEAKKLDNIRKVFGDYRNELNINKKAKGSEANRKKLTGPMNQHTAEMLGLL